jgi:FixJ family two-component response regulator
MPWQSATCKEQYAASVMIAGDPSHGRRKPMIPRISIVDDDASVREATLDLFRSMGFTAEVFACADDFLASGFPRNASCLISDMRMPGMSGLELYNHLVEAGTPIPTILMTAFPNETDKARALQAGVVGYLTKPFNAAELLGFIQLVLERR